MDWKGEKADTVLFGSSLAYDGLDWWKISKAQGEAIESWATPGSSPVEWEVHQRRSPNATQYIGRGFSLRSKRILALRFSGRHRATKGNIPRLMAMRC